MIAVLSQNGTNGIKPFSQGRRLVSLTTLGHSVRVLGRSCLKGFFAFRLGRQPQTGVTGRYPELRYIGACSESRPFTGKPGESRVARLSARVETWRPKVKRTEPARRQAATITREPSIAYGLSRLPVHRRACHMEEA